jgi:branched-chain amino acid aminotransferase
MLDYQGMVSEGSGENVFLVNDGVLFTPPTSTSILPGITRNSVITLATDLGIEVKEEQITREMLYIVDEVFLTGTAAEITPVRSIDKTIIGEGVKGEITKKLQDNFFDVIKGTVPDDHKWLTFV